MHSWLYIILFIILTSFVLETVLSILNIKVLSPELPEEFSDVYNSEDYAQSQEYTKATTFFSLIENGFTTTITILFLTDGGFNLIDIWARSFEFTEIVTGIVYVGTLMFLSFLISLPFSIYSTFVIENRFGFNRTTPSTFAVDILKSIFLTTVIGTPVLALLLWFFGTYGPVAWFLCWLSITIITILLQFLAPILILPLFNTFTPLEQGSLQETIRSYAEKEKFTIQGIYTMDGSKRSTKANAFFSGFGRFRKIVFYDTLLKTLNNSEILAVLAHEMGHFKLKHILKSTVAAILQTGIMFYILSFFLDNSDISTAFQMEHISIYASLVFFGFIYSPINIFISLFFNAASRRHEFEADKYALQTLNTADTLISSLKKLSQANLSNLTPHPLYVFFYYSHPPVLTRIQALTHASHEHS